MKGFLIVTFLYFIGCTAGWVLEVFYRRFTRENITRKWINPGFLNGPYLPLYGFALLVVYSISEVSEFIDHPNKVAESVLIFVFMGTCMTLLELIAGLIFIIGLNVKLWDYTTDWCNYRGIICPKFSLIWAALGTIYYFFMHPFFESATNWFSDHIGFSFVLGVFAGCHFIDLCYTTQIVVKIRQFAVDKQILVRYEVLKQNILSLNDSNHEKRHFFLMFGSASSLKDHLVRYGELTYAFMDKDVFNKFFKRKKKK